MFKVGESSPKLPLASFREQLMYTTAERIGRSLLFKGHWMLQLLSEGDVSQEPIYECGIMKRELRVGHSITAFCDHYI